jgi:uncharacterized protein (TIGR02001 family)
MKSVTLWPPQPVTMNNTQTAEWSTAMVNRGRAQRPAKFAISEDIAPVNTPKAVQLPRRARSQEHRHRRDDLQLFRRETVASPGTTRQTARGLGAALRETLPVNGFERTLIVIAFTAGGACAGSAHADSVQVVSGSIGGTSDFVFRGLSLTRGKPAAQASIDVEFPKEFYIGAFVSTADPKPDPSPYMEMDFWAGRYWRISENVSGDLRISQYSYPDDPRRVSYNRTELTATVGLQNRFFAAAIYSPNTSAIGSSAGYDEGSAWALEVSGRQPINERLSITAGFGHYDLQEVYHDSYNYWNVTLTAAFRPFELQFAYLGVDDSVEQHFNPDSVGDRFAVTALWRFSTTQ